MDLSSVRAAFARDVTAGAGWPAGDDRLVEAFRAIAREDFLGPIPVRRDGRIYRDEPIPLAGTGINNGQPSLHAACFAALYPSPGEHAVHIGAGTGYYTAILARLVAADEAGGGQVDAYEIEPELARRAARNLAAFRGVRVHPQSGAAGPLPAANLVYVNCGASGPQGSWLDALKPGGRLLFPLTVDTGAGAMLLILRGGDGAPWAARWLAPVIFIGCQGARDAAESACVAAAFRRGGGESVRRLIRGPTSDPAAWCSTPAWSLLR
jgi:protein-L-isoaspartate(D-aspartate) O-methyltransferase